MVTNNHPSCEKPEDCRIYRAGERLCPQCGRQAVKLTSELQRRDYNKLRDLFGPTAAKRILLERESG